MRLTLTGLAARRPFGARIIAPGPPPELVDTGGLNAASALNDALLWAVVSGAHPRRDRVGGTDGQLEGGATLATDASGFAALRSPAWGGSGWYWPAPAITGTEWTVAVRCRLDPLDDEGDEGKFAGLLSIPYHPTSWEMPFGWLLTIRPRTVNETTGILRFINPLSASQRNRVDSPDGFALLDGAEHTYGCRVHGGGDVDWLRDDEGVVATTQWIDFEHGAPDLGAAPHLIALAEHRRVLDEGAKATLSAAAIWNKAISDQQFAAFRTDPWDLAEVSTDPLVPPVLHAWDDFDISAEAGEVTRLSPLTNDSGQGLTIQSVTQPGGVAAGTEVAIVGGAGGTEIDVTVDEEETAESFDFTYTAENTDEATDTATVHVDVFVPPPLGVNDNYSLAADDTHTVSPLANDNAPEGSIIVQVTQPQGVEAGTSVAIAANNTDLEIAIDEAEEGQFEFTYTGTDGLQQWQQTVTVTMQAPGAVPAHNDEPFLGRFYGGFLNLGSGVGNTRLRFAGPDGFQNYFVGPRTEFVEKFSLNRRIDVNSTVQTRTAVGRDGSIVTDSFDVSTQEANYGRGDGGLYNIYIYPADPNTKQRVPGSQPLGGRTAWAPTDIIRRTGFGNDPIWGFPNFVHPIVECDEPFFLEAGQPYVVSFDNVHSNPGNNFFSVNWAPIIASNDVEPPPPFIGRSGAGWTPTAVDGGIDGLDWFPCPTGTQQGGFSSRHGFLLFAMWWTDGYVTGYGAGGGGQRDSSSGFKLEEFTSSSHVRERFMPSFDGLVVDGAWVWAMRKGSQSGSIVASLEQGPSSDTSGNGTVLATGSRALNEISNVGSSYEYNAVSGSTLDYVGWIWLPFGQQVPLLQDVIYNLRFYVSGSGSFWMGANGGVEGSQMRWSPIASSWAEHKATTKRPLERWRDARGWQRSSNGGSSWTSLGNDRSTPTGLRRVLS